MSIAKRFLIYLITVSMILGFTACSKPDIAPEDIAAEKPAVSVPEPEPEPQEPARIDPASVKANEAGKVMILMYHVIGAEKEGDWLQTSENFRRDLLNFYSEGYVLIDLRDFVNNNIRVPAGKTPLVLTFDDATPGHFRYLLNADGTKSIDPDSAVGILLDFASTHPEFGSSATFYMNADPFGQREYRKEKLQELIRLGFSLGNHSLTHPKLNKLAAEDVQKELALLAKLVEDSVPGYKVNSLALPFGISPVEKSLAAMGSYQGYSYKHEAVLKVGANPALSPSNTGFDPLNLPRVQGSTKELAKWLEYFRTHPEERYISDGDPATVAVPKEKAGLINQDNISAKELIIY